MEWSVPFALGSSQDFPRVPGWRELGVVLEHWTQICSVFQTLFPEPHLFS